MNKKSILFLILLFQVVIIITSNNLSKAEELPSNINLEGNSQGIRFIPGEEDFLYKKGMIPGSKLKRELTIENKYEKPYRLYIRAEKVRTEDELDILSKMNLKIICRDKIIYDGDASGEYGLIEDLDLGVFNVNESGKFIAEVYLDSDIGNEYMGKCGEVKWIFTAVREDNKELKKTEEFITSNLKTGDIGYVFYGGILFISGLVIILIKKKCIRR